MTQRERVIAVAREWVGTPFLPGNCVKGRGCDCGTLLAGIFAEAGVIEMPDLGKYDYLAPCMRGSGFYIELVERYADQISERGALPGDIVMYVMGRTLSHAALVIEWPRAVLHATKGRGAVMASGRAGMLTGRERSFFRMRGID
ncbi:MAG: C40 family peptidase [Patescibacteria group bacterium]|nr:C40 family peptidase [Patescibacteria group bacterium]